MLGSSFLYPFGSAKGPFRVVTFLSDEFDFSVTADHLFGGNWGLYPGFKSPGQTSVRFLLTNIAATTFATGPTLSLGFNSPNFNNILTSAVQPSAGLINTYLALGSGGTYPGGALSTQTTAKMPELTAVPTIHISAGATGTAITQAKARLLVQTTIAPIALLPTI